MVMKGHIGRYWIKGLGFWIRLGSKLRGVKENQVELDIMLRDIGR